MFAQNDSLPLPPPPYAEPRAESKSALPQMQDGLEQTFKKYKIPPGLVSKLNDLRKAFLLIKVDNSTSMQRNSSVQVKDACDYMKGRIDRSQNTYLTRWEEAQDRLHSMVELLAYTPTLPITVSAFDRPETGPGASFTLERRSDQIPAEFIEEARSKINAFFKVEPEGNTPILYNLQRMFAQSDQLRRGNLDQICSLYILTDGEPSGVLADGTSCTKEVEIDQIKNLLKQRKNAAINILTFLSCSNLEEDYRWMHALEAICCSRGNSGFVAAINDYKDEAREVAKDQGPGLVAPTGNGDYTFYSRGVWLLCTLAAALNPNDLDALNEPEPLTKPTLDELFGRSLTDAEYRRYFDYHPHGGSNRNGVFRDDYELFFTSQNTNNIRSVQEFKKELAKDLSEDMDRGEDDTEDQALERARQAVRDWRRREAIPSVQGRGQWKNAQNNNNGIADNQNDKVEDCCRCAVM